MINSRLTEIGHLTTVYYYDYYTIFPKTGARLTAEERKSLNSKRQNLICEVFEYFSAVSLTVLRKVGFVSV